MKGLGKVTIWWFRSRLTGVTSERSPIEEKIPMTNTEKPQVLTKAAERRPFVMYD